MNGKKGDKMEETILTGETILDRTIELLETHGAQRARLFLEEHRLAAQTQCPAQTANFRACLAALCGEREQAIGILEKAIEQDGLWYRPAAFEDDDLASLWGDERFEALRRISDARYEQALKAEKPWFSLTERRAPDLLIALHGNQQTDRHAAADWGCLETHGLQVEYLRSGEPDAAGIYRWETDGAGDEALMRAVARAYQLGFQRVFAGGFSAGCDVILRALFKGMRLDGAALVAPWLPCLGGKKGGADPKPAKSVPMTVFAGSHDTDCLPCAERLCAVMRTQGGVCALHVVPGLGHVFPQEIQTHLKDFFA